MKYPTQHPYNVSALGLLFVLFSSSAWSARASEPVPFVDAYEDGPVLMLWNQSYSRKGLEKILDHIQALGARHLTIPVWGCQPDETSTAIGSCEVLSKSYSMGTVELARARGLGVTLLLAIGSKDGQWRGYFKPADVDTWFRAYVRWLVPIAEEAERLGVSELVVGSEMSSLYGREESWRLVVEQARRVFHGPLVLTVNWDDLEHRFWESVDAIGVSAYFPLSQSANPTQDELNDGWAKVKDRLLELSWTWRRPIHVTEFGYNNETTTAKNPWAAPKDAIRDDAVQARCYEAFRQAWHEDRSLVRAGFWAHYGMPGDPKVNGEILGRPAEVPISLMIRERNSWSGPQR